MSSVNVKLNQLHSVLVCTACAFSAFKLAYLDSGSMLVVAYRRNVTIDGHRVLLVVLRQTRGCLCGVADIVRAFLYVVSHPTQREVVLCARRNGWLNKKLCSSHTFSFPPPSHRSLMSFITLPDAVSCRGSCSASRVLTRGRRRKRPPAVLRSGSGGVGIMQRQPRFGPVVPVR